MNFIRKYTEEERVRIVEEALQYGWKSCYRKYGQTLEPQKPKELEILMPDYKKQCALLTKEKKELELEVAVLRDMLKKKK
jgi:transposase-like protein